MTHIENDADPIPKQDTEQFSQERETRPKSNWAQIVSTILAGIAVFASTACAVMIIAVSSDNLCTDRRDRRALQMPTLDFEKNAAEGSIYLRNFGPGVAVIEHFELRHKDFTTSQISVDTPGEKYMEIVARRETTDAMHALLQVNHFENAMPVCRGAGQKQACHPVITVSNLPHTNGVWMAGYRQEIFRITNMSDILAAAAKTKNGETVVNNWTAVFNLFPDDVHLTVRYCPIQKQFGGCRTLTKSGNTPIDLGAQCRTGPLGWIARTLAGEP